MKGFTPPKWWVGFHCRFQHAVQRVLRITAAGDNRITADGNQRVTADSTE